MAPGDFEAVDRALAEAFVADPLSKRLFGDRDPRPGLVRMNRAAVRNPHARGTVAESGGEIVAAMIEADWPKCEPDGLAGLRSAWDMALAMRWRLFSVMGLFAKVDKSHPKWEHRHLTVIGVVPAFQRRGIGAWLLEDFCRRADEAGIGCYLETDTDAALRLYRRFGFVEVESAETDGATFRFMWRQRAPAR
jgi:ribosomal protein S18 acetylase RimI-like enzyme